MASFFNLLLLCSVFCILNPTTIAAKSSFRPKALVLPVSKDPSTLQYITHIHQRTPLVQVPLTLDLGGQFLWVDCDKGYLSKSYKPIHCRTAQCNLAKSKACGDCFDGPKPGCNNNTCSLIPDNTVKGLATSGELAADTVSVQSTDGSNPGRAVSAPGILFTCGSTFLLESLAAGVQGMAGLGRTKVSLPSLFSAAFSFNRVFAICLTASTNSKGVVFFGNEPYFLQPKMEISNNLMYTPLILNPVSTASAFFSGDSSSDYFINVKSIMINGKKVPINSTLLSINKEGSGGTKISTVNPYTLMETSIYKSFSEFFVKQLAGIPRVKAVSPFKVCYNASSLGSTRVGPAVPQIDLVLPGKNVVWRIFGSNSMVYVNNDKVACLGFVDGGMNSRTSIVIGGHQIEDNLLQFDLARSRLGFSSSLLFRRTNCANFNFTSNA